MNTKESIIRIIFLSLLLYSMLSFASSEGKLDSALAKQQELGQQLETLRAQKQGLQDKLEGEMTAAEIEQLARQRLGLVKAGEKIFYFNNRQRG